MARVAVKGIAHRSTSLDKGSIGESKFEAAVRQQHSCETKKTAVATSGGRMSIEKLLSSLKNKVEFEFYLQLYEWMYWLAKQWFSLFGIVLDESALIDSEL